MNNTKIVCFGEMLWDMVPSGRKPGGAPMNVAINLKYNGFLPIVISKVGNDGPGIELKQFVKENELTTKYIQTSYQQATGKVKVQPQKNQPTTYEVDTNVAWDEIEFNEELENLVKSSDLFIYGSLAARSKTTFQTLKKLLNSSKLNVLDINLRPPFYTPELLSDLLHSAHMVKMNQWELREISGLFCQNSEEKGAMQELLQKFNLDSIIVTKGINGAILLNQEGFVEQSGFQVDLENNLDVGDSFLGTYLSRILAGQDAVTALQRACAINSLGIGRPESRPAAINWI